MDVPLRRRVLGTLLSAGLGFLVVVLALFPLGFPVYWVLAGLFGGLFSGGYAALVGTPWMRRSKNA